MKSKLLVYIAGLLIACVTNIDLVYAGWSVDSLTANRAGLLSANAGSKAVFTNGVNWEVYDFTSGTWNSGNFIMARTAMKVISSGTKVYVAGGWRGPYTNPVDVNNIEVYNSSSGTWSSLTLSQGRTVGAAATVGNKIIFAGGYRVLAYSTRVDFFDVNSNVRTTGLLSQARTNIAVGVAGSKVVLAGGQKGQPNMGVVNSSNVVDIYDDSTGSWSTAVLSAARQDIAVAVCGSKIIFAGGINMGSGAISKKVDIYDAATGTWTVSAVSQAKYGMTAAVVGTKAYFFGGVINGSGGLSKRVEIYDAATGLWSVKYLNGQHHAGVIGQTPGRIMFAGGIDTWGNAGTARVDVLNLQTGQWTVEQLSEPRLSLSSASYQSTSIFVGGNQVWSSYPQYIIPSKRIDLWNDNAPVAQAGNKLLSGSSAEILVYPNPAKDELHVSVTNDDGGVKTLELYDITGKRIVSLMLAGLEHSMDISSLSNGLYIVQVKENDKVLKTERIIKQ